MEERNSGWKITLTLSALLLKRPIRRMVVRIGSEESSSILWVQTGGNDCRCVAKMALFIIVKSSLSSILFMSGRLPTSKDS